MAPIIIGWIFCILIAYAIGSGKGRGAEGFLLGLALAPLGVIIVIFLPPTVALQAKRDVELEQAREAERQRIRAEVIAEMQTGNPPPGYNTEIGRPPSAE